jgi:hypothetical protein
MKNSKVIIGGALVHSCALWTCQATILTPGNGPTNDTAGYTPVGFNVLGEEISYMFDTNYGLTVTFYSVVLEDDKSNPLGGLTFLYQLTVDQGSVSQLELGGYIGSVSRVNVADAFSGSFGSLGPLLFSPGGTAPSSADWLGCLDFNWSPSLVVSNNTDILVVDTAATAFTYLGNVSVDGGEANLLKGYAPIPEPTILALAGLGAAAASVSRRARVIYTTLWKPARTIRRTEKAQIWISQ